MTTIDATVHSDLIHAAEHVTEHAPGPWHVGERPRWSNPRTMWPVRDANNKVVAYCPNEAVARWIAWQRGPA